MLSFLFKPLRYGAHRHVDRSVTEWRHLLIVH